MRSSLGKNLLLTGPPGCGKTTVVRRVVETLGDLHLAGFDTRELREGGQRVGFEIVGLGGRRSILAHIGWSSGPRVGRYFVEPANLEAILKAELERPANGVNAYVIDEIGRMECYCPRFVTTVRHVLGGPVPVLASLSRKGTGLIAEVKSRPDVEIVVVTTGNRDKLPTDLAQFFRQVEPQSKLNWRSLDQFI